MPYQSHMIEAEPDLTIFERRDPLIGNLLDERFRIDARLAAGGFGAIYRATDLASGREIALKVLHANLAADPLIVARFRREGETLASLRDPHTVAAYELGEASDGTLYIVMELLRGQTLYDAYRENHAPLPWRRVAAIARAVCSSLAEAHALGIVHRDLKPANIHLQERAGERDFVKVLDFGIAKILRGGDEEQELTQAGQMIGTFDYMAPEQMLGGVVDARCDLYTLGVVMYQMITGRFPFAGATSPTQLLSMLLTTTPPSVASLVPVPAALDRAILRCLEREAHDRFATVGELAAALDGVLAGASAPDDGEERTWIAHRPDARGSAPVVAAPRAAGSAPTHLTLAAPVAPPVRAQGSRRGPGRGRAPQHIDASVLMSPRPHAGPAARESAPALPLYAIPAPIVDARGSQPYLAPVGAPWLAPALAAGSTWQQLPPARPHPASGGFDAARDAAVRRAVWALGIILCAVIALVVGKLL